MKLVLDYSIWRCGDFGATHLGEGTTSLRNIEGFECCLGQFCKQIDPTLVNDFILHTGEPYQLEREITGLTVMDEHGGWNGEDIEYHNSILSTEAMSINDNTETTPDEKIIELKKLFTQYGHEIEVINQPS